LALWARNKPKKSYRKRYFRVELLEKALNSAFFVSRTAEKPIVKEKLTGVLLTTLKVYCQLTYGRYDLFLH
jgi:hypothetical protein